MDVCLVVFVFLQLVHSQTFLNLVLLVEGSGGVVGGLGLIRLESVVCVS